LKNIKGVLTFISLALNTKQPIRRRADVLSQRLVNRVDPGFGETNYNVNYEIQCGVIKP